MTQALETVQEPRPQAAPTRSSVVLYPHGLRGRAPPGSFPLLPTWALWAAENSFLMMGLCPLPSATTTACPLLQPAWDVPPGSTMDASPSHPAMTDFS